MQQCLRYGCLDATTLFYTVGFSCCSVFFRLAFTYFALVAELYSCIADLRDAASFAS
jgi:hypothetical protein